MIGIHGLDATVSARLQRTAGIKGDMVENRTTEKRI